MLILNILLLKIQFFLLLFYLMGVYNKKETKEIAVEAVKEGILTKNIEVGTKLYSYVAILTNTTDSSNPVSIGSLTFLSAKNNITNRQLIAFGSDIISPFFRGTSPQTRGNIVGGELGNNAGWYYFDYGYKELKVVPNLPTAFTKLKAEITITEL